MPNALISVSDKTNVENISDFLLDNEFIIYSTGGTLKYLQLHLQDHYNYNNIKSIEEITEFPEILNGRVKTLHPRIYAGLLADMDNEEHKQEIDYHNIKLFDTVIVNLYPFKEVIYREHMENEAIENIDIGGVSLIRAGAKNYKTVSVLVNPDKYSNFIDNYDNISEYGGITLAPYRDRNEINVNDVISKYKSLV